MPRLSTVVLLAVLALALAVVGCGGAAAPDATPAATVPVTTPTSAPVTTVPTAPATAAVPATPAADEPVASTAAIPSDALPHVVFERADGSSVALPVEVPPRHEYSIGLSGRTELTDRGMLFYYPRGVGNAGFWMRGTHIDLAIAFVDVDGVVSEIDEMTAESLEITRPARPYEFAIEAPAGWYAAHGVQPGDRMRVDFDPAAVVRE